MFSRKQGYAVACALHVFLLCTCAARTNATPRASVGTHTEPPSSSASAAELAGPVAAPREPALPEPPPTENAPLAFFRAALERTKQGRAKTRVSFFGDSHVAADFMSGRVRERLQHAYGDGGVGFVMTGRPWRFYRHARAELLEVRGLKATYVRKRPETDTLALGLAGVAFTPGPDPARTRKDAPGSAPREDAPVEAPLVRLRVTSAQVPSGRSTRFELFFLPSASGLVPHLAIDGHAPNVVANTAPGALAFEVESDRPHDITIGSGANVAITLFGLVSELSGPGVVLDTLGIPGARARAQLYWDQALFQDHLRRRSPDLVVLSYGTNESTDVTQPIRDYAGHLREVVRRMRAAAPQASCLLVGPTDFPERVKKGVYQPRARTAQINELQRTTATEFGCAYFDVIAAMGGPLSMLDWAKADPPLGAKDLIHFTRRGYALLGDRIADLLLDVPESGPIPVPAASAPPRTGAKETKARARSKD